MHGKQASPRHVSVTAGAGAQTQSSCTLGRHSATELHPLLQFDFLMSPSQECLNFYVAKTINIYLLRTLSCVFLEFFPDEICVSPG